MSRKINPSKQYSKDLAKLLKQQKVNINILNSILNDICNGIPLDPKYRDHPMSKTSPKHYQGCRDFHYKSNICVIYRVKPDVVDMIRIGSHQDLELTENLNYEKSTY